MTAVEDYNDAMREIRELREERDRLRAIISAISQSWSEGHDGCFSPSWDQNDADPGYWLPAENAERIAAALTGKVLEQGTMGSDNG